MTNQAYKEPDFGAWLEPILEGHTIQELALEARLHHSAISRLLASSRKGKPIQPEQDTVRSIATALVKLRWIEQEEDAFIAAGYLPEGYQVVPPSQKQYSELEVELDPDLQMIGEAYNGVSDAGRRMIKSAAELALEMSREGSIGKRAE